MQKPDIETLIEAARQHGLDSEPDHEVGNLQRLLRDCWDALDPYIAQHIFNKHKED